MVASADHSLTCRSFDLKAYACSILDRRKERFSTVYACCFVTAAEAAGGGAAPPAADLLVTASSTGALSVYRLPHMVERWTAGQQSAEAECSWAAHAGAAYCLAKVHSGGEVLLLSGGDDGFVRGWRLSDVLARLAEALSAAPTQPQTGGGAAPRGRVELAPPPCLAVRLPRAESPLGAMSLPPAVQALAVAGEGGGTLYAGCSDGGVFAIDIATAAVSAPGGGCHAAAVLCLDLNPPTGCLASGSEDGTVRLWDVRCGGAGACARLLDAGGGRQVAGGAEALRCLRNPHVSCLRFEPSGSWLLAGGGGGSVALWDLGMAQRARQAAVGFVPQAMHVLPAEVLVVGSAPVLCRLSAALERPTRQPLATRSAFGLDVAAGAAGGGRGGGGGAVAVAGCGGSVELLSRFGKKTGGVFFASDED